MSPQHRASSQEPDEGLGRLLARWADAHRLTAHQSETIRREIVEAPTALGFEWWWSLLDPESGSVFQATRTWPADVSAYREPSTLPPMLPVEIMAWPQDAPDYQPYLRLT
jgi:hypothetical protein